jgi:hypothetical protein
MVKKFGSAASMTTAVATEGRAHSNGGNDGVLSDVVVGIGVVVVTVVDADVVAAGVVVVSM